MPADRNNILDVTKGRSGAVHEGRLSSKTFMVCESVVQSCVLVSQQHHSASLVYHL